MSERPTNQTKYELGASGEVSGEYINFDIDTFKVMLLNDSYVFSYADDIYDDISSYEVVETGVYIAGGEDLENGTWGEDDPNDRGRIIFDDVSWDGFSGEIIGGYSIYCNSYSDKPLVGITTFDPIYMAPSGELFTLKTLTVEIV